VHKNLVKYACVVSEMQADKQTDKQTDKITQLNVYNTSHTSGVSKNEKS